MCELCVGAVIKQHHAAVARGLVGAVLLAPIAVSFLGDSAATTEALFFFFGVDSYGNGKMLHSVLMLNK